MDNYESDFRLHVIPYIGHVKLKDVTSLMIQRVYILLEEKGLSPKKHPQRSWHAARYAG